MDKLSIGRIVIFIIILAIAFPIIFSLVKYVADLLISIPRHMESYVGRPTYLSRTYSVANTLAQWIYIVIIVPISLVVLIIISFIYTIVTGEELI